MRYNKGMKQRLLIIIGVLLLVASAQAQERKVQNRPYTDLRKFHFGILTGVHFQDLEFLNVGPQLVENEDGTTSETLILTDQDRWDAGFTVGVLGEFRLSQALQLRIAPAMYFGNRHITMINYGSQGFPQEQARLQQDLKSIYVSTAADLIYAAPRFNNYRPYVMAGLNPMLNLSGSRDDYLRLKKTEVFAEIGVGCDFYLPFFKLRPELKFMYGLMNSLDANHAGELRDRNMVPYSRSVKEAHSKIIALTFYFE